MLDKNIYGIVGQPTPKWEVNAWFNLPMRETSINVDNYEGKTVYLFCFQSWCPGCHKSGFPTLQTMQELYNDDNDVQFLVIQAIFEGFKSNKLEHAHQVARHYDLKFPFGHDTGPNNLRSYVLLSLLYRRNSVDDSHKC